MSVEIDSFLCYLRTIKRCSNHTLDAYAKDLSQFSEFCEKIELVQEWSEVSSNVVRRFQVGLLSGKLLMNDENKPMKAVTPRTVRRKLSALRAFFRYQMREGLLMEDPTEMVVTPRIGKKLPVFVPDYEMDRLLDEEMVCLEDFSLQRDLLLMMMGYYTGMRRSELVGLTIESIDLISGVIRVNGKGDKERLVPVLEELSDAIKKYLKLRAEKMKGEHTSFFITDRGAPANDKYVYRHIRKWLEEIPMLAKRSPHVLRHSFASALLNNGACIEAIRKLLGHSSLAATQVYTHNSFERLKRVYNKAHPRA